MSPAEIHAQFAGRPGATQIASAFACQGLADWLRRRQPRLVYEVGAGIGTLSAVVLTTCPTTTTLVAEEPVASCREQWLWNLGDRDRWAGVERPLWIQVEGWPGPRYRPKGAFIDFLVLDGGSLLDDHYRALAPRAVVFVEGGRRPQRAVLERTLRRWPKGRRPWAAAWWKPRDRSKGFWVYQLEPTLGERAWFAAVRGREALLDVLGRARGLALGKKRRSHG